MTDSSTPAPDADGAVTSATDSVRADVWPRMVRAHARIVGRLARDLDEAGKVPLSTYEVLLQVADSGGRLRLKDLVDRVVLSQPGLSRKVTRLSEQGLVHREPDPRDGRGVLVSLTEEGHSAVQAARALHDAGIAREFTAHLGEQEAQTLLRVFDRLADPNSAPGPDRLADPGSAPGPDRLADPDTAAGRDGRAGS
ncbi:MarR family winged helix-turn-helix transcriptional regulator [Nakamurella flava]|nr:MarR family transcriptional regulator [Nakamurella flava]